MAPQLIIYNIIKFSLHLFLVHDQRRLSQVVTSLAYAMRFLSDSSGVATGPPVCLPSLLCLQIERDSPVVGHGLPTWPTCLPHSSSYQPCACSPQTPATSVASPVCTIAASLLLSSSSRSTCPASPAVLSIVFHLLSVPSAFSLPVRLLSGDISSYVLACSLINIAIVLNCAWL